jgi:hypothetical protein
MKWDKDDRIGKKYCYSNAFRKARRTRTNSRVVPGYDLYKMSFSACDTFNRNLHDKKWPHRCGGHGTHGDEGHQNKFAMAVILQNTFNVFKALANDDERSGLRFNSLCKQLSIELYEHAIDWLS